jgi:hypothetical protein
MGRMDWPDAFAVRFKIEFVSSYAVSAIADGRRYHFVPPVHFEIGYPRNNIRVYKISA